MPGTLEKLTITREDDKPATSFQVMFNPSEYSIEAATNWTDQGKKGQSPELQYDGSERKKLSMELFFDTYEAQTDVRAFIAPITSLLVPDREKHRTPLVTLTWGTAVDKRKDPPPGHPFAELPFTCVLQSCKQQFTLFKSDGTPVRAKVSVTFLQFSLTIDELKRNPTNSADKTKTYLVKQGDTVSDIAAHFYDDPTLWRFIADANDIANPRELVPGSSLIIPAFE